METLTPSLPAPLHLVPSDRKSLCAPTVTKNTCTIFHAALQIKVLHDDTLAAALLIDGKDDSFQRVVVTDVIVGTAVMKQVLQRFHQKVRLVRVGHIVPVCGGRGAE